MTDKILGKHTPLLINTLGLTNESAVIALGIASHTLANISKPPKSEQSLSPPYALLYRLLFEYPELCPVRPPISMMDFVTFVEQEAGVRLGGKASIMLGQQKTGYWKALRSQALSPAASNLAKLYMRIIKHGEGLDFVYRIVEREALSRGVDLATLWRQGTWPRNIPSGYKPKHGNRKRRVWPTPEDTSDAITSSSVQEIKKSWQSAGELSYRDVSYFYGVTQHRMIDLAKIYENPLEISPNAALITRCLELIQEEDIPFPLPSLRPNEAFKLFEEQGVENKNTAAVLLGASGASHKSMLKNNDSNPYTLRLGYYIAKGCKMYSNFMSKYLEIANQEAMTRGMDDQQLFESKAWPKNIERTLKM